MNAAVHLAVVIVGEKNDNKYKKIILWFSMTSILLTGFLFGLNALANPVREFSNEIVSDSQVTVDNEKPHNSPYTDYAEVEVEYRKYTSPEPSAETPGSDKK